MKPEKPKQLTFWTFFTLEAIFLLGIFIGCFAIFFYLTWYVFREKNQVFDHAAFAWAATERSPAMTNFMEFITYFASKKFLLSVPPTLACFFAFFRKWRWFSVYILAATLGSFLLNQYLKNNFGRLRPETAFYEQGGFSFPSGHAMIGGAFYGILVYLAWKNIANRWLRLGVCAALVILELTIAYSRVYLNVHYGTDVLAGLAAGVFWVALVVVLLKQLEHFMYYRNRRIRLTKLRDMRRLRIL